MMELYSEIPSAEWNDAERFDFLRGVTDAIDKMSEVHGARDNDSDYTFLIWLKDPDDEGEVAGRIMHNIHKIRKQRDNQWDFQLIETDSGLLIVRTLL